MQATTGRKKFHENNSTNVVGSKQFAVCSRKILIIDVLRKLKTVHYSKPEALIILLRAKASGKALRLTPLNRRFVWRSSLLPGIRLLHRSPALRSYCFVRPPFFKKKRNLIKYHERL